MRINGSDASTSSNNRVAPDLEQTCAPFRSVPTSCSGLWRSSSDAMLHSPVANYSKKTAVDAESLRGGHVVYLPRPSNPTGCPGVPASGFNHPVMINEVSGKTAVVFIITSFGGSGGFPKHKPDINKEDYIPIKPALPHHPGGAVIEYQDCGMRNIQSCLTAQGKEGWMGIHQPLTVDIKWLFMLSPHAESFAEGDLNFIRQTSLRRLSGIRGDEVSYEALARLNLVSDLKSLTLHYSKQDANGPSRSDSALRNWEHKRLAPTPLSFASAHRSQQSRSCAQEQQSAGGSETADTAVNSPPANRIG